MAPGRRRDTLVTRGRAAVLLATVGAIVAFHQCGVLEFSKPAWAIGMCVGPSPFALDCSGPANPVLTAADVTDVRAAFVADPFLVHDFGRYFMFFEAMNAATGRASIALATSDDGWRWRYERTVLTEPFMLSYPYVFKWDGQYYMVPESHRAEAVRLYRADSFPERWRFVGSLVSGRPFNDPSIVRVGGRWWLFAGERDDTLRLYHAEALTGPWAEHPRSPLISGDPTRARPGGRLLPLDGKLFRMAQRDRPNYGNQVRVFEIVELSAEGYREVEAPESPLLRGTGRGWNAAGMHHVDFRQTGEDRWLACVDGYRWERTVRLRWPFHASQ